MTTQRQKEAIETLEGACSRCLQERMSINQIVQAFLAWVWAQKAKDDAEKELIRKYKEGKK